MDDNASGNVASSSSSPSPIRQALERNHVAAEVIACDHYRIRGGLAVESDYIVAVRPLESSEKEPPLLSFEEFSLSKTYSAFRSFSQQLEKATTSAQQRNNKKGGNNNNNNNKLTPDCIKLIKYCELVSHLIHSQRTQYLGKVNYMYVKLLAKERKRILNHVLQATVHSFPSKHSIQKHEYVREVALIIETFFLTDHCISQAFHSNTAIAAADEADESSALNSRKPGGGRTTLPVVGDLKLEDLNPISWITGNLPQTPKAAGIHNNNNKFVTPAAASSSNRASISSPVVVPLSRRERRDDTQRNQDDKELTAVAGQEANLLLDDDRPTTQFLPSYAHPRPVVHPQGRNHLGTLLIDNNPVAFLMIAAAAVFVLTRAQKVQVRLDGDIALLMVFAAFCLGLHTPRPLVGGFDRPPTMMGAVVKQQQDKSGRQLLRLSMRQQQQQQQQSRAHLEIDEVVEDMLSPAGPVEPMDKFPPGAAIGSHDNCWSDPDPADFHVRGPKYLTDKKKVSSAECLFPCRGINLLLTDTCPVNVGCNPLLFGGRLREKPTFLINFRLPWGILLFYFEIPQRFLPFVRAAYEDNIVLPSSLDDMTPAERTVCRFLQGDVAHKNGTLKIIPVVIDGPWVVRSVVGGKPAIIGNKLPVEWNYGPPAEEDGKELYLEADLDIAASSAARGILSVTRSYTQILTLNLGFVVQGNETDELPEQMLVAARLHGVDPLTSPAYPVQDAMGGAVAAGALFQDDDSESLTPVVKQ